MAFSDDNDKSHPDECLYMAGTEVKSTDTVPDGMTVMTIPSGTYAMFAHKCQVEKIGLTMKYIYGSWLPKSGMRLRDAPELEIYDQRFRPGSEDSEVDIYIPVA